MSPAPEIRPRVLGSEGSLARDLLEGRGGADELFPAGTLSPGLSPRPVGEARVGPEAFGTTTAEAGDRLEGILEGDGILVSTGQQPVLFTGPLYVLYKALGAIQLAEEVQRATGRPALAAFWIASDDHDWSEVGTARLLDRANRLRSVRLEPPAGRAERSAGPSSLPDAIVERIDELSQLLPESEFVGDYLDLFRDTYRPGRPVAEAFGRALAGVLGERPLAWLDAGRDEVKEAGAPLLRRALEDGAGGETALRSGSRRVREAGYDVQIPLMEGGTHVFYDTGEARVRVYRTESGDFRLGREGPERAAAELVEELERDPARFSPNVALRPVLESWLLPVGYTVMGPGELAYWAQLPPLFERREIRMPVLRPRPSWVVVEDKVEKVLRKVDAGTEAFRDGGDELIRQVVSEFRPASVDAALRELRGAIHAGTEEVDRALERELPGIRSSVGKARSDLYGVVSELEEAVDGRVEERREVLIRQIRKAAVHLYPDGRPQERVLSPLYYLARYGRDFLLAVEEAGRERPLRPRPAPDG